MFKVTKVSDNTYETHKVLKYVKKQENGVIILSNQEEAQGILINNDTIYAIQGKGLDKDYEVVAIEEITTEDYLIQISNQLNETKENQLTMMEAIADLYEQSEVE